MSSWHYSAIGALVPTLVKKAVPFVAKKFGMTEFDEATKVRLNGQPYPRYYGLLYGLWILALFMIGFVALGLSFVFAAKSPEKAASYIWLGLINMIGFWFILGAFFDTIFWGISTKKFRDYAYMRQIRSGSPYSMAQQIKVLLKIGVWYYMIVSPIIFFLLLKLK